MKIKEYDSPQQFVAEHAQRWLATGVADGGALNLERFSTNGALERLICLAVVADAGQVCQTAFVDPADQICFSRASRAVLQHLVDYLCAHEITFPGIFAPQPSSSEFVALYGAATGRIFTLVKQLNHFELTRLAPINLAAGHLRQATSADLDLLIQHNIAFQQDANTKRPFAPEKSVTSELAKGSLYVWERPDGEIVSSGRIIPDKTARSGEVSWIYTPAAYRRQGYATALTYMLSKQLLDLGKAACFLSADAANPAPNSIYRRIGYKEMCLMENWRRLDA